MEQSTLDNFLLEACKNDDLEECQKLLDRKANPDFE